ncbi:MAG: hypothetical protein ABI718_01150 [Acidobacteriota bacterium]
MTELNLKETNPPPADDDALRELRAFIVQLSSMLATPPLVREAPPGTLAAVAVRLAQEGDVLQRYDGHLLDDLFATGPSALSAEERSGVETLIFARIRNLTAQAAVLQDLIGQAIEHERAIDWLQGEVRKRDKRLGRHRESDLDDSGAGANLKMPRRWTGKDILRRLRTALRIRKV